VQYALTTPFQADATPGCGPYCNKPNSSRVTTTTTDERPRPLDGGKNSSSSSSPAGVGVGVVVVGEWPQPLDGGNGRCGQPVCEAGALGCGVPNATAKAEGPDPDAPGCGPPSYAVSALNERATRVCVCVCVCARARRCCSVCVCAERTYQRTGSTKHHHHSDKHSNSDNNDNNNNNNNNNGKTEKKENNNDDDGKQTKRMAGSCVLGRFLRYFCFLIFLVFFRTGPGDAAPIE
jgi:hypothetical protein